MDRRQDRIARSVSFAATGILSSLVFYPLIHETGHLIPAVVSGAPVNRFVWTPLIGNPHVSLNQVSGTARPWVDAGGILLPTAAGTLLIAVWLLSPHARPTPLWRFWLLIPGSVLLLGNLGLFWEVQSSSASYHHMAGLAKQFGAGSSVYWIEVAPGLWSCFLIGWLIRQWIRSRRIA
jgi:hypothetical protein